MENTIQYFVDFSRCSSTRLCVFSKKKTTLLGVYLEFFWTLGITTHYINDPFQKKDVYVRYLSPTEDYQVIEGRIHNVLKSSSKYYQYELTLDRLNQKSVCGKVLLLMKKDTLVSSFNVDDRLHLLGKL